MEPDWLAACRRAAIAVRNILAAAPTTTERLRETGTIGYGGDHTLRIDEAAEDAIFWELERLHAEGARFSALSEERGPVEFGSPFPLVIIDPIDGSTNAKRGLRHHAVSIAVADGPTMGDVYFGFVHDFGPDEEWAAIRGEGATLDGQPLATDVAERRSASGKLELLGLESVDPRWIRDAADDLADAADRVRALGTIAVSLCQVADARFDAMLTLRRCRAVDAAAAQLIVREAGGHVCFAGCPEALGAPLDVQSHFPVVATRSRGTLDKLTHIPIR
ncbi:MAG: Inositol-1-monophosphatase [uncultured Solirubrobacteraceae bacterium]|uniref:inositol-phosphate phosphatase n=1 Tax=uncultured Solirubrobacteraceae bacterium TaxID=1162706 RepID=A0A6J4RDQ6_9ACTN|nr:MAG: Inositol-1-monophosphatase [uncultured Solirubrobacteraceae bacterium]